MNRTPSVSIPSWVKRVICWVFSPKGGLIILLGVLFVAFVAVMFSQNVEMYVGSRLGLTGDSGLKNEILTFLGLSMGGVLLALQAVIANKRAEAMEHAAKAQADVAGSQARAIAEQAKANENTEKGMRQERLKNAIEHLGHDKVSVRLGGAYELFHLAQDTEELRQSVLDILCSHIRGTTSESRHREMYKSKPSEEIQSLLHLLFMQEHEIFKDCHINLQGSWLNGLNLVRARLEKAVLIEAHLHEVNLFEADLRGADLEGAYLYGANLVGAYLQKTDLDEAYLHQTILFNARLQGASLFKARLQDAKLGGARLQGANLYEAQLQGAELLGAQLQGVTNQSDDSSSFETRIKDRIGEQGDLSGIVFNGGLKQEDLDSLLNGMSGDAASELREKLKSHVGKPACHDLPEDSGAITGSYTKEEAEKWIAEYQEAIPETCKEDHS